MMRHNGRNRVLYFNVLKISKRAWITSFLFDLELALRFRKYLIFKFERFFLFIQFVYVFYEFEWQNKPLDYTSLILMTLILIFLILLRKLSKTSAIVLGVLNLLSIVCISIN